MATTNYYTSAYQNSVPNGIASQSDVQRIQQQLNAQGAGLKVDGIWGPLTNAAYSQYGLSAGTGASGMVGRASSLMSATGQNPGAAYPAFNQQNYSQFAYNPSPAPMYNYSPASLERLSYNPRSETDIQAEAAGTVNPTYDRYFLSLEQGLARNKEEYGFAQEDLARQKDDLSAQNAKQYEQQRSYLEADAVSRGMGRSSYLTEVTARSQQDENAALQRINENWQMQHNRINTSVARLTEEMSQAKAQGEREKAERLQGEIMRLREADRALGLDIQKFNADQSYREQSINAQMQQMAYESQLAGWKAQSDAQAQSMGWMMDAYNADRAYALDQQKMSMQSSQWEREFALAQQKARATAGSGSSQASPYFPDTKYSIGFNPAYDDMGNASYGKGFSMPGNMQYQYDSLSGGMTRINNLTKAELDALQKRYGTSGYQVYGPDGKRV